ncbi:outer membrane protein romA [Vibrio ishigakensis]|uniref:Outer membrane protein romA n=2 Tax=Vibrio ishigakensis TaxID=1481914 RepID=A0A0B8P2Q5_9VIBR|nr:MBL fold metallo-hydrolase [Vibrio ishigakensis]GAM57593.1 outer membrane protein romA [Vibrio ishigakensis]
MSATPLQAEIFESKQIDGKFQNSEISYSTGMGDIYGAMKAYFTTTRTEPVPTEPLPSMTLTAEQIENTKQASVARLGHSTMLIRLDGKTILTDPVFSDRASPVQWAGPKRFQDAAISLQDLPHIDMVVISHDHYDHLDKGAIKALHHKVDHFLVPLKIAKILTDWGVSEHKVIELDWWEEKQIDSILFAATPTQHFSGRGLFDKDSTLWASWVIKGEQANLYFSGDSGYFSGFKAIGEKYGPFDLTMMETGAYSEAWSQIHMMPEQSVQAHIDLKGKAMLPIHNSTFDLSVHDWFEPLDRALSAAQSRNVQLVTPIFGQMMPVQDIPASAQYAWWREVQKQPESEMQTASVK